MVIFGMTMSSRGLELIDGTPFKLGANDGQAYKQLGNAVNVNMIYMIQERVDEFLSGSPDFPSKPPIQKKLL
jgi:site-specific DNA-cytosine methylase